MLSRVSPVLRAALVMSGVALVACGSEDLAKPGNKLSLIFTGKSHSEYLFTLENPTDHAIHLRVFKSHWFAPIPVDTAFDCKNQKTGEATVGGFPIFDSVTGGKDPPIMEVSPGKATKLRLKISETGSELAQHKGEDCQLHLELWQQSGVLRVPGELIDSQVFQP
jgi:hypothetical protein